MKKYLIIICILISSNSNAQDSTDKSRCIKMVEEALNEISNAWNTYKLVRHDKLNELYTLPYESDKYKSILNSYPDSLSYYIQMGEISVANGDGKIDNRLTNKITEWLSKSKTNKTLRDLEVNTLIQNFHPTLKGWRMRCRILSNDKEENIEVHFDKDLSKITDILSSKDALIYENMGNAKNATQLMLLKEEFDNRKQ